MAGGVSLLMIGGEFDLSTGVAVISSALTASLVQLVLHHERPGSASPWPWWSPCPVGFINGWILIEDEAAQSFIVTWRRS